MSSQFDAARSKAREVLGMSVVGALSAKGYDAVFAATKEDALSAVMHLIPDGASVGVPGTVTIREIGAMEALAARGCKVYQHWLPNLTPEARKQAWLDEFNAEYFLTSANAVTRDGRIVNVDGNGNRVSAMAWSPGTLIFVIGINKVAANLDEAVSRMREASPPNAIRLGLSTPCAQTGYCVNCSSPARICRALLILEAPTTGRKTHVIMVGEELGY